MPERALLKPLVVEDFVSKRRYLGNPANSEPGATPDLRQAADSEARLRLVYEAAQAPDGRASGGSPAAPRPAVSGYRRGDLARAPILPQLAEESSPQLEEISSNLPRC